MRVKVEPLVAAPLAIAAAVHSTAHAADDALTLLRIHSRTVYNFGLGYKMFAKRVKGKSFNEHH
jgi:hypothetical protein